MNYMRLRHIILFLLMTLFITPVHGQEAVGSNIVSRTLLQSYGSKAIEQRVYDNGLGDIVQEIQSYPGSGLPSIVVQHEYDEYRRKTRTWLPVTSSGSDFISSNMVASLAQSQYSDSAPFSRTVYDNFLASQPSELYMAGSQWQNHGKKVYYSEYVGISMSAYKDGYLCISSNAMKYFCNLAVDEDGGWSAEYTDLNGRLRISETSQGKTYYVYNAKGDISYVIPPALSKYILENYDDDVLEDTDGMMKKYAYIYRYDKQRHCIYKKLPGCDPTYYIYERAGNCILSQDGYQRRRGWWAYSIPDKFGRPCISGICKYRNAYSAEPLHSKFVYAEYDGSSNKTGGYTIHNLTLQNQTLYTAIYYDGYSFIGHHGVPSSLTASVVSGFPIDNTLGRGMQTGSATAVLNGESVSGYTYSAMYYDSHYRVAQVKSTNHMGGTDVTCTEYSYTGKPLTVKILHTKRGTKDTEVDYTYAYDDADRKDSYTFSISHGEPEVSSTMSYEYDALGRLSKTIRPFTTSVDPVIEYNYDLHGWTKKITTHSFQEELSYADGLGTPCYNGNISSIRWKDKTSNAFRGYKYTYDNANRLTSGVYGEGDALTTNVNRFSENVGYDDVDGNITAITRYGKTSANGYGQMDNLSLSYDGYRLTGVTETAADYNVTGSFEYKKAKGSQYKYNKSGSLIADKSRDIAFILHDYNNNPCAIYFTNGNVTKYVYSGSGEKLRVVHYTAKPNITRTFGVKPAELTQAQILYVDSTDYLLGGSLVVKNGRIDKCYFEGGFTRAFETSATTDRFVFYYYNKDHLGNNREVVDIKGRIHQVTNYYPFGAPFADEKAIKGESLQPYKYNGKELDLMHGLNTYDYGARQYDPILARWDRIDSRCEDFYAVSPYVYANNNPVKFIDPDGNSPLSALIKVAAKRGVKSGIKTYIKKNIEHRLKNYMSKDMLKQFAKDADDVMGALDNSWWETALELVPVAGDIYGGSKFAKQMTTAYNKLQDLENKYVGKIAKSLPDKERKKFIKNMRSKGVADARKDQTKGLPHGGDVKYEKGKGIDGHHSDKVSENPDKMTDPRNIEFMKQEDHIKYHQQYGY